MLASRYPNLHFIPAGKRLRESPELLGSPAMTHLMDRVRPQFDVIVVDSPPLGAGVDPLTLGTLTGSIILVLRTGATDRDIARTHLTMVRHLPIRILGVVLNDVRPEGMYGYYGYYYLAGYNGETAEGATNGAGGAGTAAEPEPAGAGVAMVRQQP
jgi:Mrp family chromosome partitioning ATPase